MQLIEHFMGFEFDTDYSGRREVSDVELTRNVFDDEAKARSFVTDRSYGTDTARLAAISTGKITKAYQNAFESFFQRYREYRVFKDGLTIAYGRSSSKVTCPDCGSSISLAYGKRFRSCPVCHSLKIISDSNWKLLDTKRKLAVKASETLRVEAQKSGVTFICGIEWHC